MKASASCSHETGKSAKLDIVPAARLSHFCLPIIAALAAPDRLVMGGNRVGGVVTPALRTGARHLYGRAYASCCLFQTLSLQFLFFLFHAISPFYLLICPVSRICIHRLQIHPYRRPGLGSHRREPSIHLFSWILLTVYRSCLGISRDLTKLKIIF